MKAALAGRQDPALCIAGRTSAIQISGLDDAIARGKAYEEAGVDALFFVGVRTRAELDAISAATRLPLILGGVSGDLTDSRISRPPRAHRPAGPPALRRRGQGDPRHPACAARRHAARQAQGIADAELMKRVTRDADYTKWTKDFWRRSGVEPILASYSSPPLGRG